MTIAQTATPVSTPLARWLNRSAVIQWVIFLITIPLVLSPILPIIYQSVIDRPVYDSGHVFTFDNFRKLFSDPQLVQVTTNTLIFAVIATFISQFFGAVFAVLIGRTNLPMRRWLGNLLLFPHLISALILSLGWFMAYGSAGFITLFFRSTFGIEPWSLYSLTGMAVVAGTTQIPLALLYCLAATSLADPNLEDAARVCGANTFETLRRVTLPLLTPAIIFSGILNFTGALETLSIPLVFGEPVGIRLFMTYLYSAGFHGAVPDYGIVATAAMLLLVIVGLLVWLQSRMLRNSRRFVTVGGKATRPRLFNLGPMKWPAFIFVGGFVLLFVVFPVCILALRAMVSFLSPLVPFWNVMTPMHLMRVLEQQAVFRSITNSLFIATVGGAIATVFIAFLALVVHRSPFPYSRSLNMLAMVPRALPGLIAGIGVFYAVTMLPGMGWLRNTVWLLIIVFTMRGIPTGYGTISSSLQQISVDLDRSARVMGADWWVSMRAVVLPLLKPALATCFALMFIAFFKDYSTAIFLIAPGSEIMGTMMLSLWLQGETGQVAVLGTLQIVITIIFIALAQRLLGVNLFGARQ